MHPPAEPRAPLFAAPAARRWPTVSASSTISSDERLVRVDSLALAAEAGVTEDLLTGALLHAARLGLFEMSWNMSCPHCRSVLSANATLRTVRASHNFCDAAEELRLDDRAEVTFTVGPASTLSAAPRT